MPFLALVFVPDHTTDSNEVALNLVDIPDSYRLVGLFRYPERKELTCRGSCLPKGKSLGGWVRDRLGFMKCVVCGSRHRKTRSRVTGSLFDNLGANLYEDAPAVFRTPEGYRFPYADND